MAAVDPRYSRQILFDEIGEEGQERIGRGSVLVVGCGALGCVAAGILVRAGVGRVRIVDRDIVEANNLQRQVLFDEEDARALAPKAPAAAAHLRTVNSGIDVEGIVADLTADSIARLAAGADIIVDGTDNFETRFLLNDWCVKEGIPWIYGAAVGSYGVTLSVRPGESACLTCVFETAPPAGSAPTCDTVGVLASTTGVIGAIEAAESLKFLAGREARMSAHLTIVDVWEGRFDRIAARRRTDPPCATCVTRRFPHLAGAGESRTAILCGRGSVQVSAPPGTAVDLEALAARLAGTGAVERTPFLVRMRVEGLVLTVFGDGRAIVEGTTETERARAIYARYVGV
jgi:molybdopterin/thiamine biosynthesis adenylyltransferase